MSDFRELKSKVQKAKKDLSQSQNSIFLSRQRIKKLGREREKLLRGIDSKDTQIENIDRVAGELKLQIANEEAQLHKSVLSYTDLLAQFDAFTDPRKHIQQLSDEYPVLLFPVRLETRFKKINTENGEVQHQLWVRIFPDDCSVDTFEDTLTEAEVKKAQDYWLQVWSAGSSDDLTIQNNIQSRLKAAWKGLAGSINSGRAYWVTQNYLPVNQGEIPERETEEEIILVIHVERLPADHEKLALENYWSAYYLAQENIELIANAYNQFIEDTKTDQSDSEEKHIDYANALLSKNTPFNLDDPIVSENPDVKVVFIVFPETTDIDTTLSSWSQAAKVTTLPERFVLIGFKEEDSQGNPKEVLNEIGSAIPDPLVMGPDPSVEPDELITSTLIEEYLLQPSEGLQITMLVEFYSYLDESIKKDKSQDQFVEEILGTPQDEVNKALTLAFKGFKDEIKATKYIDYLTQRSETKWLFDFEEAIRVGMGFKVDLAPNIYQSGFDRLFVVGVKLGADELEAKSDLEDLIKHHHFGSNGFSIIPQGTPTNNTEDEDSGFSEHEDSDETFERYFKQSVEDDPDDFFNKKDGKWLSEFLGIDADNASLKQVANYYHTDQCEAKALNMALWNATIGYFMESMLTPIFSDWDEEVTRYFFTHFVSGRGNIPAIRIGDQPYGILTTSTLAGFNWPSSEKFFELDEYADRVPVIKQIYRLALKVQEDWQEFINEVAFVGKEDDAHKILLEVLGLHATSVEFEQRYAESLLHLFNTLNLYPTSIAFQDLPDFIGARELLKKLGFDSDEDDFIPILEKLFLSGYRISGDLIDGLPLSEKDPIRAYTSTKAEGEESKNYIYWLIENALSDHDNIKSQKGFEDKPPTALLYQMLLHSLELGFSDTAFKFYQEAQILNKKEVKKAKVDPNFVGIEAKAIHYQGRYAYLDQKESKITDQDITVAKYISNILAESIRTWQTKELHEIVDALEHLKDVPTARLERAFVEHLDCCTYRLDAWLLGFVNLFLYGMRYRNTSSDNINVKQGVFLGTYGWVENLKPDNEELSPATLSSELKAIFDPENERKIITDSSNAGYIHAPSINQATTAAVLRNAYISNADPDDPDIYKVNLSSERVRMALSIIKGMQQGQSLGALLGYQFERGLHDRYNEAEVDFFIYEIRREFPLNANQLEETAETEGNIESIAQIEARNVVNGLALIEHIKKTNNNTYPFGKDLTRGSVAQEDAINSEVQRLLNINDAVADLALSETVHQVVQSNYDRAAGTIDTYSKGAYPQSPDVVRTPRSGVNLTNRVGIHLESGLPLTASDTPRAVAEPAINQFILKHLPPMSHLHCKVVYKIPSYDDHVINEEHELIINMEQLGLAPIDLLYTLYIESDKSLTVLDDYILSYVHDQEAPRPDAELEIRYTESFKDSGDKISLFEISPLVKSLRSLLTASRPLQNTDILLQNEASNSKDYSLTIKKERIDAAYNQFKDNFPGSNSDNSIDIATGTFVSQINLDNINENINIKNRIIDGIDTYIEQFINRQKIISKFGEVASGFGFIFDRKAEIYAEIYQKVLKYKHRWGDKLEKYEQLITDDLPDAATEQEEIKVLQKAERTISTSYTIPLPEPTPGSGITSQYIDILNAKKDKFTEKYEEIKNWLGSHFLELKELNSSLNKLRSGDPSNNPTSLPLDEFDLLMIETEEEEKQIIVLAEDLVAQAFKLNITMKEKAVQVQTLLEEQDEAPAQKKKNDLLMKMANQLFGEEFKVIPEFQFEPAHGAELKKVFDHHTQLLKYQKEDQLSDFPMDDWLYGIARVREKMGHWENTAVLAEGFQEISLDLLPFQLPYKADDSWLGLSYPEDYEIGSDRLLYTAYFSDTSVDDLPQFDENKPQCGLLIDEWTEVIPSKTETTGISFQYDQPNAEPPQAMLLVTPPEFTGQWKWDNLVNSLHETLDLGQLRAVEPAHFGKGAYAQFLPATVSAVTTYPFITMALNYAVNNGLNIWTETDA